MRFVNAGGLLGKAEVVAEWMKQVYSLGGDCGDDQGYYLILYLYFSLFAVLS
jgi:hypothetical protein